MEIVAQTLTALDYAPYGHVLSAKEGGESQPANRGTAEMFQHLTQVQNLRPGKARENWKIYRCQPNLERPVQILELEKHPFSTQLFAPIGRAGRYLVAVARGENEPDLTTLKAFVTSNQQIITYHPGIWHLPMTVLDGESDMLSLVYEDGSDDDCVIWAAERRLEVVVS